MEQILGCETGFCSWNHMSFLKTISCFLNLGQLGLGSKILIFMFKIFWLYLQAYKHIDKKCLSKTMFSFVTLMDFSEL